MKKILFLVFIGLGCNQQEADLSYDTSVAHPAYTGRHPKVLFDEAHRNFHTTTGRYAPFVNLIRNDGYEVAANAADFSIDRLNGHDVLVIANAKGKEKKYFPAFSEEECRAVHEWVESGGALLLVADHYPMGSAALPLAATFGIGMGNGYVSDSVFSRGQWKDELIFSRQNGLLNSHPIFEGRHAAERVSQVVSFTGQSLKAPEGAEALLRLSASAREAIPDSIWEKDGNTYTRFCDPVPLAGRCQGLAMTVGKGRIVVLGEAAMLTAQISDGVKFGMNAPDNDNRQFVLNIMHWLTGLIPQR